jgi:hypothetical protein
MAGLFGGAFTGGIFKKIFGGAGRGLKALGKVAGPLALVAAVGFGMNDFMKGWNEAGESAGFGTKLKGGIAQAL